MLATECMDHEAFQKLVKHITSSNRNSLKKRSDIIIPKPLKVFWLIIEFILPFAVNLPFNAFNTKNISHGS